MTHEVGYGAAVNAWVCAKWSFVWLAAAGLPCALAMYFPAWPAEEKAQENH